MKKGIKKDYISIGIMCLLIFLAIAQTIVMLDFYQDKTLYKNILSIGLVDPELRIEGDAYYEEHSLYYERGNYLESELSCKKARDSWSGYMQLLREEKEKVSEYKEEIFDIYSDLLSSEIRLYSNMFEACEWYEASNRHFDYYYQATTPANDVSYEDGIGAIEEGNKKIAAHDAEVEVYNTILARYSSELNRILE